MSVGAGLMSRNSDVIASCLNKEEAAEWRQLCDRQEVSSFQAEQKVFYCGHCNDLFCQLIVNAGLTDGKSVVFGNKCDKCGNELHGIDLEARHMVCPVCKTGDLSWKQTGFWD